MSQKQPSSQSDQRKARLAERLRANLKRRKRQNRQSSGDASVDPMKPAGDNVNKRP